MLIERIKEIVIKAGENMLAGNVLEVTEKGSAENYVSNVDIMNENYLKKELTALIDGSKFIGEESGAESYDSEYLWVVDPIDGTANFVRGMNCSAVSVALLHNKKPSAGVVYNPYTKELFWAEAGKGAYVNGRKLTVSGRDLRHSIISMAMSVYDKRFADGCFKIAENLHYRCEDMRRMGSAAIEMSNLAAGRIELYFEIRLYPWDYAAAALFIEEAGGYVGSLYSDELQYKTVMPIIAANTKENYKELKNTALAAFEGVYDFT